MRHLVEVKEYFGGQIKLMKIFLLVFLIRLPPYEADKTRTRTSSTPNVKPLEFNPYFPAFYAELKVLAGNMEIIYCVWNLKEFKFRKGTSASLLLLCITNEYANKCRQRICGSYTQQTTSFICPSLSDYLKNPLHLQMIINEISHRARSHSSS